MRKMQENSALPMLKTTCVPDVFILVTKIQEEISMRVLCGSPGKSNGEIYFKYQVSSISEMVRTKILSLNENKSPGPDNIHPFFLKRLARVLCLPISMLFNLSLRSGTNAEQWREAILTAIHKKGARDLAENYRPISLTSIIIKLMESLIRDAILPHMVKNKFFNSNQHGFLPRRNCTT